MQEKHLTWVNKAEQLGQELNETKTELKKK